MEISYKKYWDDFLKYIENSPEKELSLTRKNQGRYYYGFSLGISNCDIAFSVSKKQQHIGCELYLKGEQAKDNFNQLRLRKDLKQQLPAATEWQYIPEGIDCRIISTFSIDFWKTKNWVNCFHWYKTTGVLYQKVFTKHLKQVLPSSTKATQEYESIIQNEEECFKEGQEKFETHRIRERDSKISKLAKRRRLEEAGVLICDVCGFSFQEKYGPIGEGFIEAHHTVPISAIDGERETLITEIALVCSNCHRMLHKNGLLNLQELKEKIIENKNT